MVAIIKKNTTKKYFSTLLKKLSKNSNKKGLDAKKYAGTVIFKEDGLALQKKWRDEWK